MSTKTDPHVLELPNSAFLTDDEIVRKFRSQILHSFREWPKCKNKECQHDLQVSFHRGKDIVRCSLVCFASHDFEVSSNTEPSAPSSELNYVGDWDTSASSVSATYDSWGKPGNFNLQDDDSDLVNLFKGTGITFVVFSGW